MTIIHGTGGRRMHVAESGEVRPPEGENTSHASGEWKDRYLSLEQDLTAQELALMRMDDRLSLSKGPKGAGPDDKLASAGHSKELRRLNKILRERVAKALQKKAMVSDGHTSPALETTHLMPEGDEEHDVQHAAALEMYQEDSPAMGDSTRMTKVGNPLVIKVAKVIAHVGGLMASGKSTLLDDLQSQHGKKLKVLDLDEIDWQGRKEYLKKKKGYGWWDDSGVKSRMSHQELDELTAHKQKLLDQRLKKWQKGNVLLAGYHNDGKWALKMPDEAKRVRLDVGPVESAVRDRARSWQQGERSVRKLVGRPIADVASNMSDLARWKRAGYQKANSQQVSDMVADAMGAQRAAMPDRTTRLVKNYRRVRRAAPAVALGGAALMAAGAWNRRQGMSKTSSEVERTLTMKVARRLVGGEPAIEKEGAAARTAADLLHQMSPLGKRIRSTVTTRGSEKSLLEKAREATRRMRKLTRN